MLANTHPVVEVEGFSGPFDLLLRLIERGQLDVLAISLAAVADQYLEQLSTLRLRDPEHLSAFLVVAAKLLLIKSSRLLPVAPRGAPRSDDDDPTDLTERLRGYQRYRAAADTLRERLERGLRSYPHLAPPYQPVARPAPAPLNPELLRQALRRVHERQRPAPEPKPLGEAPYSVAKALTAIRDLLRQLDQIRFGDLVPVEAPRSRLVATFLAVLEVARLGVVSVDQDDRFGPITLRRRAPDEAPRQ